MNRLPIIVAHRGCSDCYPENTLPALEAALTSGAQAIEFDVQLSADAVPVLFHDHQLQRVTGKKGVVTECSIDQLMSLRASESSRFGQKFQDVSIPRLQDAVELLLRWPDVQVFVELKIESLNAFGRAQVLGSVCELIKPIQSQCSIISFDREVLELVKSISQCAMVKGIGWVLDLYNDDYKVQAENLQPDYLICNIKKIPKHAPLWQGRWQWMLYESDDVAEIEALYKREVAYVETNNIAAVLKQLKTGGPYV